MSEPMWIGGDPFSYSNITEDVYEFDCGNDECDHSAEVPCQREDALRVTRIWADWVCPECGYENQSETEWDSE